MATLLKIGPAGQQSQPVCKLQWMCIIDSLDHHSPSFSLLNKHISMWGLFMTCLTARVCCPIGSIFSKALRIISNISCEDSVIITHRTDVPSPEKKTQVVTYCSFFFKTTLWSLLNWNGKYLAQFKNTKSVLQYIKQHRTIWLSSCACLSLVCLIRKASSPSAGVQICQLQLCSSPHMQMTRLHCSHFGLMSFVP